MASCCLSSLRHIVPVQVWTMQTTKDVLGQVNHLAPPISMQPVGTHLHKLQLSLDAMTTVLATAQRSLD